MLRLGFAPTWVDLIMLCVTTVRYSVVVNGNLVGPIVPKRGLRQGDLLSPICLFYVHKFYQAY